ncbi:MAG: hypothetical protein AB7I19_01500 [Planctomycetota bacterium]
MKKLLLSGLALAVAGFGIAEVAYAHGGQYRGPGDTVPPNPGGRGGRTPGPSGPSTPGPGGPSTPGPGGPGTPGPTGPGTGGPGGAGPAGGPTTGGVSVEPDLDQWEFWWEFNKDPFIKLREAIQKGGVVSESDEFYLGTGTQRVAEDTQKPTDAQKLDVLQKLHKALESTDQNDIVSSCMVGMAKIGMNTDQINILDAFKKRLTDGNQEIRETAAVAMGISQMTEAVPMLSELAKDSEAGRKLCTRDTVDPRTRSFAIYGLGLIGYATADHAIKNTIFATLKDLLENDKSPERDIRVAAINAVALLRPNHASEDGKKLLFGALDALDAYWAQDLGPSHQLVQSHVPPAIAKLFEGADLTDEELGKRLDAYKKSWLLEMQGKSKLKRTQNDMERSVIVALGRTGLPVDGDKDDPKLDAEILKELDKKSAEGSDSQSRYFAMMAMGQMGGAEARTKLLKILREGKKALERPWAAISLGVMAHFQMEEAKLNAQVDQLVGKELMRQFDEAKTPSTIAAMAIGLGLVKYSDAGPTLIQLLDKYKNQDELAGYLCIGMALMGYKDSIDEIQDVVRTSTRRGERLRQAAIALGKLGDKDAATTLITMLTEDESGAPDLARMSAIASALGFIGDRRSIDPLVKLLFDTKLTNLSRAFAAVALGGIADKELLPWNSKIAVNMNYRASVETLTNQAVGILDIL